MASEYIETDREDLHFTTRGTVWIVSGADGGPDLAMMGDRDRAVLRALLNLSLSRLDAFESGAVLCANVANGGVGS